MAVNPYQLTLDPNQMTRIRALLEIEKDPTTQRAVDFTMLSDAAKPIVGQANWDIMQTAKAANCGCQVTTAWPPLQTFPRKLETV